MKTSRRTFLLGTGAAVLIPGPAYHSGCSNGIAGLARNRAVSQGAGVSGYPEARA